VADCLPTVLPTAGVRIHPDCETDMTLALALLLIGASGSAERTLESRDSIAGIVIQVVGGAVKDAFSETTRPGGLRRVLRGATFTGLEIDGRPRSGIFSWLAAADRIAGYALDRQTGGSVEYSYRLQIQQYHVLRRSRVVDDQVTLTTSTGWTERIQLTKRLTREVPISVTITITATEVTRDGAGVRAAADETAGGTRIRGVIRGTANVSDFRCQVVRGIAENRAGVELDAGLARALLVVKTKGRAYYHAGASDVLDALRAAIRIGRRMRR